MSIKPHCMGTAFPERSVVRSVNPTTRGDEPAIEVVFEAYPYVAPYLPTAADLDAVAEEQRVKEETE